MLINKDTDWSDLSETDGREDGGAPVPTHDVLFEVCLDEKTVAFDPGDVCAGEFFNWTEGSEGEWESVEEKEDFEH